MTATNRQTSRGIREAEMAIDLLRGMRAGSIRVGLGGKPLLSMDAKRREVRMDVGAIPTESGLSWMRSSGSLTQAIRGISAVPKLAAALNDIDWTVRVDVDGREVAVFGHGGPALTGHIWVKPNPAILADRAREAARRWRDRSNP